ncbi:hypothetical protein GCM10023116_15980 [Kistimonas scapharcae]|uniref:Uncharacterized protein n=1 Tax=Kistimonas scapharcae TaxID=1036133 RepID=A0ABP8V177_9GAMM
MVSPGMPEQAKSFSPTEISEQPEDIKDRQVTPANTFNFDVITVLYLASQ